MFFFFFFKQKTAYEMLRSLVGSEMCIRDSGKSAGIDEITGEMIKNGGEKVIDWIWNLCNKAFMEGIVPRDCRRAVIVPLYKGKGEKGNCMNYRGISLLSVVAVSYTHLRAHETPEH